MKHLILIKALVVLILGGLSLPVYLLAGEENVLLADCRQRPPEMIVNEKAMRCSGPLLDIFDEVAKKVGFTVKWRIAPFRRSIQELEMGTVDIIPRVILTEKRKAFVAYLGPIGYQNKDIVFLVRERQENLINTYDDLKKLRVGVKTGTAYFKQFNEDTTIKKDFQTDDENMVRMFAANRFDTMIVLDVAATEKALRDIGFYDFDYANYRYVQKIGNYYGMSKKSKNIDIYSDLNSGILDLVESGKVEEIYMKYSVLPPRND